MTKLVTKNGSWHEAADDLRAKLSRYASRPRFNEEFEEAFAFFFGEGPDEMQDDLEASAFNRFMEWFIYDYRLSNGHRLIELFAMEHAIKLNSRAHQLLGEWSKSCFTLLQIKQIGSENIITNDLLLGGQFTLRFPSAKSVEGTLAVGHLLVGRPIKVGDIWELPAGVTVLPGHLTDHVIQLIRGEYRRYHRNRTGSWYEFLHDQGFVFNDLIETLADLLNDANTAVSVRVIYNVVDMSACKRWLNKQQSESAAQSAAMMALTDSLRLVGNRLEVRCTSLDEVPFAKEVIAEKLGKAVKHRLDLISQEKNQPPFRFDLDLYERQIVAASDELEAADNDEDDAGQDSFVPVCLQSPQWQTSEQSSVAHKVAKVLTQTGASEDHIDSAMWLWNDFCTSEQPRIRTESAWAAAIHCVLGRVEGWHLRYAALARVYGAKAATVSRNAARISAVLDIQQFDDRYCVEHPVDGLLRRLGEANESHHVEQVEELIGAGLESLPAQQSLLLDRLVELRAAIADYALNFNELATKAQTHFYSTVGCSLQDHFWQDCFNDWFHFDWALPVKGGRTLLAEALKSGELPSDMVKELAKWVDCHPAYYLVESVYSRQAGSQKQGPVTLMLRPLLGGELVEVNWPIPGGSLKKQDVILARLVPLNGSLTSVGHALHFVSGYAPAIRLRMEEERMALEHWGECKLKWEDISKSYAERLYAIAYQAVRGFPNPDAGFPHFLFDD